MRAFTLLLLVSTTACFVWRGEARLARRRRLGDYTFAVRRGEFHISATCSGAMVTGDADYCCPEGLRRAQNRPYPCGEDTDFDYYCPCISEDVEEGTNGWYFLRWVGDEEGPITCEEVAAERKREEEEKLAYFNRVFCSGECGPEIPEESCTQTMLQCLQATAESGVCPLTNMVDAMEATQRVWTKSPVCIKAREEVEERSAQHRRRLGLRKHGVPSWML